MVFSDFLAVSAQCVMISSTQAICEPCSKGYHRKNNHSQHKCLENKCRCENGLGNVKESCLINEGSDCFKCNFGFHLVETSGTDASATTSVCKANECSCKSGSSGVGYDCPINQAEWCLECMAGYWLSVEKDKVECLPCNPGEHFDEYVGMCRLNECTCSDGVEAISGDCVQHGIESCSSCSQGYHEVFVLGRDDGVISQNTTGWFLENVAQKKHQTESDTHI